VPFQGELKLTSSRLSDLPHANIDRYLHAPTLGLTPLKLYIDIEAPKSCESRETRSSASLAIGAGPGVASS
jgi:hypothetical protein